MNAGEPVTAASPTDCRTRVILPAAPSPVARAGQGAPLPNPIIGSDAGRRPMGERTVAGVSPRR